MNWHELGSNEQIAKLSSGFSGFSGREDVIRIYSIFSSIASDDGNDIYPDLADSDINARQISRFPSFHLVVASLVSVLVDALRSR